MANVQKKIAREHIRTGSTIDKLVAAGLTRDANLSKTAFLKKIGREGAKNTEQAEREAIFNLAKGCIVLLEQITTKLGLMEANIRYSKGE